MRKLSSHEMHDCKGGLAKALALVGVKKKYIAEVPKKAVALNAVQLKF